MDFLIVVYTKVGGENIHIFIIIYIMSQAMAVDLSNADHAASTTATANPRYPSLLIINNSAKMR